MLESGLKGKVRRGEVEGFKFGRQDVVVLPVENASPSVPQFSTRLEGNPV